VPTLLPTKSEHFFNHTAISLNVIFAKSLVTSLEIEQTKISSVLNAIKEVTPNHNVTLPSWKEVTMMMTLRTTNQKMKLLKKMKKVLTFQKQIAASLKTTKTIGSLLSEIKSNHPEINHNQSELPQSVFKKSVTLLPAQPPNQNLPAVTQHLNLTTSTPINQTQNKRQKENQSINDSNSPLLPISNCKKPNTNALNNE